MKNFKSTLVASFCMSAMIGISACAQAEPTHNLYCEGSPQSDTGTSILQVHLYSDSTTDAYRAEVALYTTPTFIPSPPPPNYDFSPIHAQGDPAVFSTSNGRFQLYLSNPARLEINGEQFEVECSQE
jgi:hypothetical protein